MCHRTSLCGDTCPFGWIHVGTAALGCPVERSSIAFVSLSSRRRNKIFERARLQAAPSRTKIRNRALAPEGLLTPPSRHQPVKLITCFTRSQRDLSLKNLKPSASQCNTNSQPQTSTSCSPKLKKATPKPVAPPALHKINHARTNHPRLARLRHLLDHPRILAPHPSAGTILALPPPIPIQNPSAPLGRNVDCKRRPHRTLVRHIPLSKALAMDSRRTFIRCRLTPLQTVARSLHPATTRRIARATPQPPRTAPHHYRHPRPPPPSRLSRPPLRDARLELRHRPCRLLGPHRIRNHHRRHHGQNGGSRTGKKIR